MYDLSILYLVACFVICVFGIWVYSKKKDFAPLYIGIAFGLFTIDRFIKIFELAEGVEILGIVLRIAAYLLVFFALYKTLVNK